MITILLIFLNMVIKPKYGQIEVHSGKYMYVRLNMDNNCILGPNKDR